MVWLIAVLAILSFVVSVFAASSAVESDTRSGIPVLVMWIFGGLSLFLIISTTGWLITTAGVISFLIAIIAGFYALPEQDGKALLVAISYITVALILLDPLIFNGVL